MRKFLIIAYLTFAALPVFAQVEMMAYRPIYWVLGRVADAGDVKADGRTAVFYKDDATYNTNNVQAVISGNKFALNAFYLWPLELKVGGIYKLTIIKGADGWGMDPVNVVISGNGYDEVFGDVEGGPLTLKSDSGVADKPAGGG